MPSQRQWSFSNMPLYQRLALALLPAIPIIVLFGVQYIDGFFGGFYLLYGVLFGVFVLAPYVSKDSYMRVRVTALTVTPVLLLAVLIQGLNRNLVWMDLIYLSFVVYFTVFALTLGAAVKLAAPLKTSLRYWLFVLLSGSITGLGFGFWLQRSFDCIFSSCPGWVEWILVVALMFWHLSFCAAVYFGRATEH